MALEAPELATYQMVGLPVAVAGPVDLGRLIRELEALDEALSQAALRGQPQAAKPPKTTQLFDRLVELNKLDMAQAADRQRLQGFLGAVRATAPVLHISFGADPSVAFVEKIMSWLRREIHPLTLITIGLQPNLGAGCVVRSINKQFDFSLRQDFVRNQAALLKVLGPALAAQPPAQPATVAAVTPAGMPAMEGSPA